MSAFTPSNLNKRRKPLHCQIQLDAIRIRFPKKSAQRSKNISEIVIGTIYYYIYILYTPHNHMVYTPICTQNFMFLRISATSSPSNLIRSVGSESSAKPSAALPFSIQRPPNFPLFQIEFDILIFASSLAQIISDPFGASILASYLILKLSWFLVFHF